MTSMDLHNKSNRTAQVRTSTRVIMVKDKTIKSPYKVIGCQPGKDAIEVRNKI